MTKKKFIKYATATKCRIHLEIVHAAVDQLAHQGFFSKEEVLRVTGYDLFEDAIHWDHVRRMIEEQHKTDLMPLAQAFFNRKRKDPSPIDEPGRYLAGGTGKKTAGFAMVSEDNGPLVRWSLEHAKQCIRGKSKAYTSRQAGAVVAGIQGVDPEPALASPDLQH